MINGNQTWQAGLSAQQKQALYVLIIPQFGIVLASFAQSQLQGGGAVGGWGVMAWGAGAWGT